LVVILGGLVMPKTEWPSGFPESVLQRRPELAQKVGLIIDRWGYIERTLRNILASILNIKENEAFSVLHALPSFQARLDILRAAGAYMPDGKDKAELFELFDKLGRAYIVRNTIVHGWYLGGKDIEIILAKPARKADVRSPESVIDEHLARLEQLFADLLTFALSDTDYPKRRRVKWRHPHADWRGPAEKTCPRCAERIKAAALVCHFCGYELAPEKFTK
jgi:uncharacterized protein UPF0547